MRAKSVGNPMIEHSHEGEEPAVVFLIGDLIDGEWYWVRQREDQEWFLARWDDDYQRFTNDDCWEDLAETVVEWVHVPRPSDR